MAKMLWLVSWVLSAVGAAVIGHRKGQLIGGTVLGVMLGPVGLLFVVASSARPRAGER